ncbi:hypothetical protein FKM82_027321 [Ascaphus truei]
MVYIFEVTFDVKVFVLELNVQAMQLVYLKKPLLVLASLDLEWSSGQLGASPVLMFEALVKIILGLSGRHCANVLSLRRIGQCLFRIWRIFGAISLY